MDNNKTMNSKNYFKNLEILSTINLEEINNEPTLRLQAKKLLLKFEKIYSIKNECLYDYELREGYKSIYDNIINLFYKIFNTNKEKENAQAKNPEFIPIYLCNPEQLRNRIRNKFRGTNNNVLSKNKNNDQIKFKVEPTPKPMYDISIFDAEEEEDINDLSNDLNNKINLNVNNNKIPNNNFNNNNIILKEDDKTPKEIENVKIYDILSQLASTNSKNNIESLCDYYLDSNDTSEKDKNAVFNILQLIFKYKH